MTKRAIIPPISKPSAPSMRTHKKPVKSKIKHSNLLTWKRWEIIYFGISLHALVIRIDAIIGIGIIVKTGTKSKITIKTTKPLINWLILELAPLWTLTAVLTRTPVHGVPPNIPQTIFEIERPAISLD